MSRQSVEFDLFGVRYETKQFSAIEGMSLLDSLHLVHPTVILKLTNVVLDDGTTRRLNYNNIKSFVVDKAGNLPPKNVMEGLKNMVIQYSFGFLDEWERINIPHRFLSDAKTITPKNYEPMTSQLIQEGMASLMELETYYSLEDAFKMFDLLTIKTVNQALAQEKAESDNKR